MYMNVSNKRSNKRHGCLPRRFGCAFQPKLVDNMTFTPLFHHRLFVLSSDYLAVIG